MAVLNATNTEGLYKVGKEVLAFVRPCIKSRGGYASATEYDIDPISLPDVITAALLYVDGQELKIELGFKKKHDSIDIDIYISPTDIGKDVIIWQGESMGDGRFNLNKSVQENIPKIRFPVGQIKEGKQIKDIGDLFNAEDTRITAVCYKKK